MYPAPAAARAARPPPHRDAHRQAPQVAEISEPAALEALRPEWIELHAECPESTPFQSADWLIAWSRHFCARGLFVLAVRREGRLVGLAPLFIHRDPGHGERQVTLLGNGISDRLDLLVLPGEEAAASRAVFDHLDRCAPQWDSCDFRDLPQDSELIDTGLAAARTDLVEAEAP